MDPLSVRRSPSRGASTAPSSPCLQRFALALVVLLSTGACAPSVRPPAAPPALAGVEHGEVRLPGHGGVELYAQSWRPAGPARGVVLIVHGLKDHSARYAAFAQHLATQGFAVHAFDLRGHGRSGGARAQVSALADYVADLEIVAARVKTAEAGLPLVLMGHSMGGAIATTYALEHPGELQGLVLSGAALRLGPEVSPSLVKITRKLGRKHPDWRVLKLKPKWFSRDPAVVADVSGADPLVDTRKIPASTAAALIDGIERIQADMEKLAVPVLILHGGADRITPPEGSRDLFRRAGVADKQLEIYPDDYHDLLHEPRHEAVIADITAWLVRHADSPRA